MSKNAVIKSPHRDKLLTAHQFQGSSNDCGPFCIAIAANALKKRKLDGHKLGEKLNGWVWREIFPMPRRITNWATLPWGVADELRQQGFQARWRFLSTQENLRRNLANSILQIVIVGDLQPIWGHYMLLVDYHPKNGWGFVNPATNSKKVYWISPREFNQQWNALGRQVIEASP